MPPFLRFEQLLEIQKMPHTETAALYALENDFLRIQLSESSQKAGRPSASEWQDSNGVALPLIALRLPMTDNFLTGREAI